MASRPKSAGSRNQRGAARNRKPATIDLEAKEVAPEGAKTAARSAKASETAKTASADKAANTGQTSGSGSSPKFGRSTNTEKKEPDVKSASDKQQATEAKSGPSGSPDSKPVPAATGSSSGSMFSGLLGAVIAVVGLGVIGQFEGARNIPLIGSLFGGGNTSVSGTVSESEFVALQEKVAGLSSAEGAGISPDLDPINTRINSLESSLQSLSEAAASGSSVVDSAMLERLLAVEKGLIDVAETLAGMSAETSAGESDASSGLDETIAALGGRVSTLESDGVGAEQLEALAQQLAELEAKLGAVDAAAAKNSEGVASLVSQSTELKDTVASVQASEKVAKSVAVNALATALDNDDPLALPIASVEALIGELPETQRLAALGANGIPTTRELVADLDAFTNGIQNPLGVSEDASLSDRFWANAQSLVSFRSTGPREGDDPLAIMSRVKDAVLKGNLALAKTEWSKLPVEIQETGKPWAEKLDTRMEAYALQKEISSKLALQAG